MCSRGFKQYTLLSARFRRKKVEYTVQNVETKPALFRATTPSKEILLMVVPASLLFIFIFIVTLILHTMQSFKHHLRSYLYFRASFLTVWKSIVSDESVNSFHASWSPSVSPSPSSTKLGDRTVIQPIPSDLREMFVIKRTSAPSATRSCIELYHADSILVIFLVSNNNNAC